MCTAATTTQKLSTCTETSGLREHEHMCCRKLMAYKCVHCMTPLYIISPTADAVSCVSACRQEGMTSVLAAGGLLEGLARGTAALAPASPACQALSHILTQVCTKSLSLSALLESGRGQQAANQTEEHSASVSARVDATLEPVREQAAQQQQAGIAVQQGAAAIACCQTWQVSVTCSSCGNLDCRCFCLTALGTDSCLSPK